MMEEEGLQDRDALMVPLTLTDEQSFIQFFDLNTGQYVMINDLGMSSDLKHLVKDPGYNAAKNALAITGKQIINLKHIHYYPKKMPWLSPAIALATYKNFVVADYENDSHPVLRAIGSTVFDIMMIVFVPGSGKVLLMHADLVHDLDSEYLIRTYDVCINENFSKLSSDDSFVASARDSGALITAMCDRALIILLDKLSELEHDLKHRFEDEFVDLFSKGKLIFGTFPRSYSFSSGHDGVQNEGPTEGDFQSDRANIWASANTESFAGNDDNNNNNNEAPKFEYERRVDVKPDPAYVYQPPPWAKNYTYKIPFVVTGVRIPGVLAAVGLRYYWGGRTHGELRRPDTQTESSDQTDTAQRLGHWASKIIPGLKIAKPKCDRQNAAAKATNKDLKEGQKLNQKLNASLAYYHSLPEGHPGIEQAKQKVINDAEALRVPFTQSTTQDKSEGYWRYKLNSNNERRRLLRQTYVDGANEKMDEFANRGLSVREMFACDSDSLDQMRSNLLVAHTEKEAQTLLGRRQFLFQDATKSGDTEAAIAALEGLQKDFYAAKLSDKSSQDELNNFLFSAAVQLSEKPNIDHERLFEIVELADATQQSEREYSVGTVDSGNVRTDFVVALLAGNAGRFTVAEEKLLEIIRNTDGVKNQDNNTAQIRLAAANQLLVLCVGEEGIFKQDKLELVEKVVIEKEKMLPGVVDHDNAAIYESDLAQDRLVLAFSYISANRNENALAHFNAVLLPYLQPPVGQADVSEQNVHLLQNCLAGLSMLIQRGIYSADKLPKLLSSVEESDYFFDPKIKRAICLARSQPRVMDKFDSDETLARMAQIIQENPNDIELLLSRANMLLDLGDVSNARNDIDAVTKRDSTLKEKAAAMKLNNKMNILLFQHYITLIDLSKKILHCGFEYMDAEQFDFYSKMLLDGGELFCQVGMFRNKLDLTGGDPWLDILSAVMKVFAYADIAIERYTDRKSTVGGVLHWSMTNAKQVMPLTQLLSSAYVARSGLSRKLGECFFDCQKFKAGAYFSAVNASVNGFLAVNTVVPLVNQVLDIKDFYIPRGIEWFSPSNRIRVALQVLSDTFSQSFPALLTTITLVLRSGDTVMNRWLGAGLPVEGMGLAFGAASFFIVGEMFRQNYNSQASKCQVRGDAKLIYHYMEKKQFDKVIEITKKYPSHLLMICLSHYANIELPDNEAIKDKTIEKLYDTISSESFCETVNELYGEGITTIIPLRLKYKIAEYAYEFKKHHVVEVLCNTEQEESIPSFRFLRARSRSMDNKFKGALDDLVFLLSQRESLSLSWNYNIHLEIANVCLKKKCIGLYNSHMIQALRIMRKIMDDESDETQQANLVKEVSIRLKDLGENNYNYSLCYDQLVPCDLGVKMSLYYIKISIDIVSNAQKLFDGKLGKKKEKIAQRIFKYRKFEERLRMRKSEQSVANANSDNNNNDQEIYRQYKMDGGKK